MARIRKTTGKYKGGHRDIYEPDLNAEEPVNTMRKLIATDPSKAWGLYSKVRSIARKRQERAEKNPIMQEVDIIQRRKDLGGFKPVKQIKASKTPENDLVEAYSDVMSYLANEETTYKGEITHRKQYIENINQRISDANGTRQFELGDYTYVGKFFQYVDKELEKKYGPTKWKQYRDSNQILNAISEGLDYGLDMKDIYDTYLNWKRKQIRLEKQRARRNVKSTKKNDGLTREEFENAAKRVGLKLDELN